MKSSPILFTPDNAQKVHDGNKTQTRRIIKPQPLTVLSLYFRNRPWQRGMRLWVREAWRLMERERDGEDGICYRADLSVRVMRNTVLSLQQWGTAYANGKHGNNWRPSIYMPKWACRTWLELTSVRAERVQAITEPDAIAEGCTPGSGNTDRSLSTAVYEFRHLWESIHGHGSWDANPWVWVLAFKRVQP